LSRRFQSSEENIMSRTWIAPAVFAFTSLATALAQAGTVTFLHYNDLHAHLTAHADLVSDTAGQPGAAAHLAERGGLARLATLIKQQRAAYPATHTTAASKPCTPTAMPSSIR
jgi:2',3'-cyclic-nucleotide 2'-phosphodiesterase (5'-nucleotidase family)